MNCLFNAISIVHCTVQTLLPMLTADDDHRDAVAAAATAAADADGGAPRRRAARRGRCVAADCEASGAAAAATTTWLLLVRVRVQPAVSVSPRRLGDWSRLDRPAAAAAAAHRAV